MTNSFIPTIGITLDLLKGSETAYSGYPWLALCQNYTNLVIEAGGISLGIPPLTYKNIPYILDKLDGIIISGGNFDIPPSLYGNQFIHPKTKLNEKRSLFELELLKIAWEKNMPVLGICNGAQLMAVFLGGTLYQHLPDDQPEALPHEQSNPPHQGSHLVEIQPESLLSTLSPKQTWVVNSSHHQAIQSPGNAYIGAFAEDGIIEAIEDPSRDFFLGVQWHPEFAVQYTDRKIFSSFIAKARLYAQNRS